MIAVNGAVDKTEITGVANVDTAATVCGCAVGNRHVIQRKRSRGIDTAADIRALPPVTVSPLSVAVTLLFTRTTRVWLLPLIDKRLAPGPSIVTLLLSTSWSGVESPSVGLSYVNAIAAEPLANRLSANTIVSASGWPELAAIESAGASFRCPSE